MNLVSKTFWRGSISALLSDLELFRAFSHDLKNGGIAAIPTDTLYGFAVDAESKPGVDAVYQVKGRKEQKPLILFLHRFSQLADLGIPLSSPVQSLLRQFWPGALTGVFQRPPGRLSAFAHASLGIRIPSHPGLLNLLEQYPGFLLTTSANRSGQPPISNPDQLEETFKPEISWLIDDGIIPLSEPSTVADMTTWPPVSLRQGKIRI